MIKAVIFDMDGVISDTLPLHSEAESQALEEADKIIDNFSELTIPMLKSL